MQPVMTRFDAPELRKRSTGKVRELFDLGDQLLLVATDRLSAFDVVFSDGIPGKGRILTQLSAFWFAQTRQVVPNHLVTADLAEMPEPVRAHRELAGRAMLCRKAEVLPVECIVRGYLEGSGWKAYQATGELCGIRLPGGLQRRSRLPEPIFTPSTKAEQGDHDENITLEQCRDRIGAELTGKLAEVSVRIYEHAHAFLAERGIVIADTKFEFGLLDGELILVDEALTPDSSRFWVKGSFEAGGEPISYDKQYVRDYLETLDWDKRPPAPALPPEVIRNTTARYMEIYQKITGSPIEA